MRRLSALALLTAFVLTACSDDGGTEVRSADGTPARVTEADLARRDWRIDAVTDATGDRREIDPVHDAVLRFDGEGGFSAKTCNSTGGDVVISPTSLEWGAEIVSTSMACMDEDLTWLESTMAALYSGTSSWAIAEGRLRIEGNGVTAELSERPEGFPTEIVQLATSDPECECEWQFGYGEATEAEVADGADRYFLTFEGRTGPGTAYGSAGLAVDDDIPFETMWLDDVEGKLFPYGTLPIGTTSAVFETTDGTTIELHPYELPDGRLVYGEPIDATQGEVVALDANGEEIARGRVVPVS